jgi:hypothetical protein
MKQTTLTFPEINLPTREAHRLRGYFGNFFKEHSPLLHNHYADGKSIYQYPLVQYKVIEGTPTLSGFGEGAQLLMDLFLQINELKIGERIFPLTHKQIKCREVEAGIGDDLYEYKFETVWMALTQKNHTRYLDTPDEEKRAFLEKLLCNHILAAFKGTDIWVKKRILVKAKLKEVPTKFKDQSMLAFHGTFTTNAQLPDLMGIGKSVSRGYGSVRLTN